MISYALSICLLGLLIWKFLSWLRLHHNLVVLTYSIATLTFLVNMIFTLLYVSNGLSNEPSSVTPTMDPLIIASNSSNTVISSFLFGIVFTLIYNSAYAVGGLLFGIAFWTVARNVREKRYKKLFVYFRIRYSTVV